jgi:predicted dehydrogenase
LARLHELAVPAQESSAGVRFLHADFSFPLRDPGNPRLRPELGGGALLDVGCYTLDVARWFCGEPDTVTAVARVETVDMSVAAAIRFPQGAEATVWASFDAAEHQELVLVTGEGTLRIEKPFTAWRDPHDPYQLMVEAFAQSVLDGIPPPRTLDESLATALLIDRVRSSWT